MVKPSIFTDDDDIKASPICQLDCNPETLQQNERVLFLTPNFPGLRHG